MIVCLGDLNYCDGYFDIGIGTGTQIMKGLNPLQYLPHRAEDFWIGNFECVCSSLSKLNGYRKVQFNINPQYLKTICHPNIYSVANNHVMQHGADAYKEMLLNIESFGSQYVGSDERRTVNFIHQGKKVAITAFNQRPENFRFGTLYWSNPEYDAIEKEYHNHVKDADYKIVYIHWGNEFMNYPYLDQIKFAHWLIDLGYDLIVGMHPHILQGFEVYKNKYIFYSIGNTVFNMAWYKTHYGAIVKVDLGGQNPIVTYNYIQIDKQFSPHLIDEKLVPTDCQFSYLNGLINHNIENEKYYSELVRYRQLYRKANYMKILKDLFHLNAKAKIFIIKDFIVRHLG